jgi:hypothetical protein
MLELPSKIVLGLRQEINELRRKIDPIIKHADWTVDNVVMMVWDVYFDCDGSDYITNATNGIIADIQEECISSFTDTEIEILDSAMLVFAEALETVMNQHQFYSDRGYAPYTIEVDSKFGTAILSIDEGLDEERQAFLQEESGLADPS